VTASKLVKNFTTRGKRTNIGLKMLGNIVWEMPVTDLVKRRIAQQHRLYLKICRYCGARNAATANRCRKCRGKHLRWKKRELGGK